MILPFQRDEHVRDWLYATSSSLVPNSPSGIDRHRIPVSTSHRPVYPKQSSGHCPNQQSKRTVGREYCGIPRTTAELNHHDRHADFSDDYHRTARFKSRSAMPPDGSSVLSSRLSSECLLSAGGSSYLPMDASTFVSAPRPPVEQLMCGRTPSRESSAHDSSSSTYSLCTASVSVPGSSSQIPLKSKYETLERQTVPRFTFHEMPPPNKIPAVVNSVCVLLSMAATGCESIPGALRTILRSDDRLAGEAGPPFLWGPVQETTSPTPSELVLWDNVQEIVHLTRTLRETKADEAAYYGLARIILQGATPRAKRSPLFVRHVTLAKFNDCHLPRLYTATASSSRPHRGKSTVPATKTLYDIRVDLTLEHALPTPHKSPSSNFPYSLLDAVTTLCSPGPYAHVSLVASTITVKTPFSAFPRAEAELQAAVGASCMIADRREIAGGDPAPFPVVSLMVLGETWYYQISYYADRYTCVVLPAGLAGDSATHVGVFRLLAFVEVLRKWCVDVYCVEYINVLKQRVEAAKANG